MSTVILRLAGDATDGQLHGVLEVVGTDVAEPFTGDASLLALLHEVDAGGAAPGGDGDDLGTLGTAT